MRTLFTSCDELLKMFRVIAFFLLISALEAHSDPLSLRQSCLNSLKNYKSYFKDEVLDQVCEKALRTSECNSVKGEPIFHLDYPGVATKPKKILVLSLIHGDETHAGGLGRFWAERLNKVDARNTWRIIPVANPDGVKAKTRTNAEGVDLNRNFPTLDWTTDAQSFWKNEAHSTPRKFPGVAAGKEPEVRCLMQHLEDFKPDFVISIHTPLKVLDFDGPKLKPPSFSYLPWKSLGNFPGSLGRYLWVERKIPVLTTELREDLPVTATAFEQLQDLIGTLILTDLK